MIQSIFKDVCVLQSLRKMFFFVLQYLEWPLGKTSLRHYASPVSSFCETVMLLFTQLHPPPPQVTPSPPPNTHTVVPATCLQR